ncbi:DUF4386 domain-containing protein [Aquimarina muelleri]|uniref:DUF4386 domain-containing protein n=1 Tax=Aquimarina muelleri TaxID=279356 RepID=UPI000424E2ED|nr:DUF4386 domain-containing protein [Aquimarina muelleri]MCX2763654.1 DUF4386 domain-containing protein [Aquimarina muelleri]
MESHFDQLATRSTTRAVGILYIFIVLCSVFSILYVPSKLFVHEDIATTVSNIRTFNSLFRLSLLCDIIVFLCEIILAVLLYQLLKHVSSKLSMIAVLYRLAMAFVMSINLLNYFFVLILLSGASYLVVFETNQLYALVMLFIKAHEYGEYIWSIFFAFHLMVFGYLIFKSRFFPKAPGILMMIGCLGHLLESFKNFLIPDNETLTIIISVFLLFSFVGEMSFVFWLLFKKRKNQDLTIVNVD